MKYNIFTVLNEGYASFGKLLVSSIFDKIDMDKLGEIIICDTGISEETRKYLSLFPKTKIVPAGFKTEHSRIHDDDWKKTVYSKAKLLLRTIENYDEFVPTVMIDCDCIVVEDFSDILGGDFDVAPCLRNQAGRKVGHQATSTHIGSFFFAATDKSVPFIRAWISEIPKITATGADGKRTPQESPALSNICERMKTEINIFNICEREIANIEHYPPETAKVYHLKSDFLYLTVEKRISQPRANYYTGRYLR